MKDRSRSFLVLLAQIVVVAGCASTPGGVADRRIDCDRKECRLACNLIGNAEDGNPSSQLMAGHAYWNGSIACVPADDEAALRWYRKAADHGESSAMSRIAEAHRDGRGVTRDHPEALKWYRRALLAGDRTPDTRSAHDLLSAQTNAPAGPERSPWTLSIATRWDGEPELAGPRGAAAEVSGKVAVGVLVGGALALEGGAVGAAIYGGLVALSGMKDGIETGKAGDAIHEEVEGIFAEVDLGAMVHDALRRRLLESGLQPAPRLLAVVGDGFAPADTRIELAFRKAELRNTYKAWQFHQGARPPLVLFIEAGMRLQRAGEERPFPEETIAYTGQQTLDGRERAAFERELETAADDLAGTILRRIASSEDRKPVAAPAPEASPR